MISDSGPTIDHFPPEVRSNAHRVYLELRDRIIQCRVLPLQKLKIAELASEFDVSNGAIREALSRLTTEQLVVAKDQRGFTVAPITSAHLDDLTDARVEIECILLRRAMDRGDDGWRDAIRIAADRMLRFDGDPVSVTAAQLHIEFHQSLVAASGSPLLLRIRESLLETSQRYLYFAVRKARAVRDVADEHEIITKAVLAGDQQQAVVSMARHIRRTADVLHHLLDSISAQSRQRTDPARMLLQSIASGAGLRGNNG